MVVHVRACVEDRVTEIQAVVELGTLDGWERERLDLWSVRT